MVNAMERQIESYGADESSGPVGNGAVWLAVVVSLTVVTGCWDVEDGAFECADDSDCIDGYVCDGQCVPVEQGEEHELPDAGGLDTDASSTTDDAVGQPDVEVVEADEFHETAVEVYCQNKFSCCRDDERAEYFDDRVDVDDCVDGLLPDAKDEFDLDATHLEYDGVHAAECLEELDAPCEFRGTPREDVGVIVLEECAYPPDRLEEGEQCDDDFECQGRCVEGFCGPLRERGESCESAGDCESHLFCREERCTRFSEKGEDCEGSDPACDFRYFYCSSGECKGQKEVGEECSYDLMCSSWRCDEEDEICEPFMCME